MDKVYVVICSVQQRWSQEPGEEIWVESVHRTEAAAHEYVRDRYAEALQRELDAVLSLENSGYQPELRNFWRVKSYALKD